jgi:hypothetical protein
VAAGRSKAATTGTSTAASVEDTNALELATAS